MTPRLRAERARYREALERIADWPCENNDTGDEEDCPDLDCEPCPPCIAREALVDREPEPWTRERIERITAKGGYPDPEALA